MTQADNTPLTDAALAEIEARADAATAGPWGWRFPAGGRPELWSDRRGGLVVLSALRDGLHKATVAFCERATPLLGGVIEKAEVFFDKPGRDVPDYQKAKNPDAAFIAHSRTDIPALLAEVRRLRAENERLRDAERIAWAMARKPYELVPFIKFSRDDRHPKGAYYFAHKKYRQHGATVIDSVLLNSVSRNAPLPVLTPDARAAIDAARKESDNANSTA